MCRWVHDEQQAVVLEVYGVWQALLGSIQERSKLFDVVQVRDISESKILVGCTTSGAAKYRHDTSTALLHCDATVDRCI